MSSRPFDDLAEIYEAMVNWPRRLAHEEPFYRRLFEDIGSKSVVDVACGSGQHAAMFHSWGQDVEGSDISQAMLDQAKALFGEPPGLRWVVRGYDEPIESVSGRPFDVAICVGNSLALAPDLATVERAFQRMLDGVRAGGAVVVHVLNVWRLPEGPCTWQKCVRASLSQGEAMIVKGVSRCGPRGFVHLVVTTLEAEPTLRGESVPFLGLEPSQIEPMALRAGASRVQFFGDYYDGPYDRSRSADLLVVARK